MSMLTMREAGRKALARGAEAFARGMTMSSSDRPGRREGLRLVICEAANTIPPRWRNVEIVRRSGTC